MNRSLHERIAGLRRSVGKLEDSHSDVPGPVGARAPVPDSGLLSLGFHRHENADGTGYWMRTLRYDLLTVHGANRFFDLLQVDSSALLRACKVEPYSFARLCFFDTETTGLGLGAGTFPFLYAVAAVESDELVLRQLFLADHGDERATLEAMLSFVPESSVLVTFNGKSFDWPLVKNRLIMHRLEVESDRAHVDLLYPSRRLWRRRLERVNLGTVEKQVLGLERIDDLPGREAPSRFFRYLEERDARVIAPVLEHNATDVCSLVTLMVTLSRVLGGVEAPGTAGELVALARWHQEWSEYDLALLCFHRATTFEDADWRVHWLHSLTRKKLGDLGGAVAIWEFMAQTYPWSTQPAVELAKYFEHQVRDLNAAHRWTTEALSRAQSGHKFGSGLSCEHTLHTSTSLSEARQDGDTQAILALNHRLNRIEAKLSRIRATT